MKRLILGIGNPILGDDGVGFRVIDELGKLDLPADTELVSSDSSGLALLDFLVNFDEAVIVDAIQTVDGKPGVVYRLGLDNFRATKHTISPHDVDLPTALELGKLLKLQVPGKISIIGIEIPPVHDFSKELSGEVAAAVPVATRMVIDILNETA